MSEDSYIEINNFEHYQHYKERNITSWIKLYYAILDDYKIDQLFENERWVFIALLLLAGKYDNKIPNDLKFLNKKICHDSTSESKLKSILDKLSQVDMIYTQSRQTLDTVYTESTPIRREEIRVDKKRGEESAVSAKQSHSSFNNVLLTAEEHSKLVAKFGVSDLGVKIERVGSYIASRGFEKKYKSHYAVILNWDLKEKSVSPAPVSKYIAPIKQEFDTRISCGVDGCPGKIDMQTRECNKCDTDEYKDNQISGIKIALKSI